MGPHLRPAAVLSALVTSVALFAPAAPAQLAVDWRDGDLGGNLDFVLRAPAGTLYVDILSLTEGPTCFGPKHPVGCIDVDLSLFYLSFQLPGFFATMGASGELVVSVGVPTDPVLDGIVLNQQMVSLVNGKFTEKSNLCKIVFGSPDNWSHSLSPMGGDPFAVPAITLPDGRILLAGSSGANLDECELYEPCRQTFAPAASLAVGRAGHTVTQLQDGRVLVVGGTDVTTAVLASAELYDPSTDAWSSVGSLATQRAGHTANLLPDGRVLVAGGTTDVTDALTAALSAVKSTEIFDPSTLAFTAGPNLARPHAGHASVTLANGDVLVGGGASWRKIIINIPELSDKAQLFLSSSGAWSGESTMKAARVGASAILLADGRAFVGGGIGGSITSPGPLASSETFDPATGAFTASGTMSVARSLMTLLRLDTTNLILVAGGGTGTDLTSAAPSDVVEIWDPATGLFFLAATLPEPRAAAGGLVQPNHHAILFGGVGAISAAAIYRD